MLPVTDGLTTEKDETRKSGEQRTISRELAQLAALLCVCT
jgi:hypothetical protein